MRRKYFLLFLLLLTLMMPIVSKSSVNAATVDSTKIYTVTLKNNKLYVKNYKGKVVYTSKYIKKYVYTTCSLNIRRGYSTSSPITRTLDKGTRVLKVGSFVTSNGTRWAIVKCGKGYRFCVNKYLTSTKPLVVTCEYLYSPSYFMRMGIIYYNGWRWTWYSQRVLPGGGLSIPGRHVDDNGYVCDTNGYICLASSNLSYGSVVNTPFGKKGKVYDNGCSYGTLDVYTNW